MKRIIHFSGTYINDGATKSVINLNNFLNLKKEIQSKIFMLNANSEIYPNIDYLNKKFLSKLNFKFKNIIHNLLIRFFKKEYSFAFFLDYIKSDILNILKKENPNIVHFHWIPRSIELKDIKKINQKIIITMRDYWLITGGCNYPVNCTKFYKYCNTCPHLRFSIKKDLSYFQFKRKRKELLDLKRKLHIVVLSKEMKKELLKLNIFSKKNISLIPNSVDNNKFFKTDKLIERKKLKIFTQKKIVLFGAQNLEQEWKGLKFLMDILKLKDNSNLYLLTFGIISNSSKNIINNYIEAKHFGYCNDDKLRSIYNAADVFLFCSTIEAFGKVILESLFCHTPVLAFDKYAAKDIITHGKDGYLARYNDVKDFYNGISICLSLANKNSTREYKKKINTFNQDSVGRKYLNLYNSILS
jgi:glycosyltransferase involved in cell wall biosynthesis